MLNSQLSFSGQIDVDYFTRSAAKYSSPDILSIQTGTQWQFVENEDFFIRSIFQIFKFAAYCHWDNYLQLDRKMLAFMLATCSTHSHECEKIFGSLKTITTPEVVLAKDNVHLRCSCFK